MSLMWRRLNYLCATILVLSVYIETATGQTSTDIVTTVITATEIVPVTTSMAEPTTATTAIPTTALPSLLAPDNVTVEDVVSDNTAFTVSWDHNPDLRLTVTYDIMVSVTGGSETETVPNASSGDTIAGKTPGQEYDIIVVAVEDKNGRREDSDMETFRLQPNIVDNLRHDVSSTTSVTAVWDPPLNSVFDSYNIGCSNGTADPMILMKGGTREASCTGVAPGRLVTITVTTVSGSRGNSDDLDIWSKPNTVQDLEGDGATTSSVSVTWSRPSDHIDTYYYIVDCSPGVPALDNITDGATTATCSQVPAGSLVTVNVTTHSGSESNGVSTKVRGKPNSVVELSEVSATTNSVTASWQKPAGEVTQYDISCSHGNPQPLVVTANASMTYSATCENIPLPGTECTMTVTSVSVDVDGDDRSVTITADPIPPALEEAASTVTSISVKWEKPNSVVDFYIIDCPDGTESSSNITATDGTLNASCTELADPGKRYSISVKSQSNEKLSVTATLSTNALPASVILEKNESLVDTVSATWMAPMGVFDQFTVQCEPAANAEPLEDVILYDPIASSYKADCNVSIPGDLYNMIVVSRSGIQDSSSSMLDLRALPEAVDSFTIVNVTTNMVELQWTMKNKCESGGCVWSSFNVSHTPDFSQKNVSQNERSATFASLTSGEIYTFTIIVLSEDERSTPVTVVERTKPNIVDNLRHNVSSTTSVTAVWNPPLNSVFDSYNISCSNGTADPMIIMKGGTREASCNGVAPGRLVTITVTTVSGSRGNSDDLDIWSKPNTVKDLEGDGATTSSVSVTWRQPDDHIDTYYYIVSCSDGIAAPENITDGATTTATCSHVPAGSLVTVSVTTHSGSESNGVSTTVRVKPNSVDALSEVSATTDSVTASWQKPADEVTKFDISCSHGNPQPPVVTADGSMTYSATCENITLPGTECTMTVTSVSFDVDGDDRSITITADPIPPALVKTPSTVTSISVEWEKPDSVVDFYIIDCPDGTESSSNITAIDGTLNASCTELTVPGDLYNISVKSQSKEKLSVPATRSINALPEAVDSFTVVDVTTNMVELQWTMKNKCESRGCVWSSFKVSRNPPLFEKIVLQNETSTSFASLTPGENYTFTIIVLSEDERSSPVTVVGRTKPNIVENLHPMSSSTTSVTAVWDPPLNGVFDSYNISCSSGTADPMIIMKGGTREASCTGVAPGRLVTITVTTVSGFRGSSDDLDVWSKPNTVQDLEGDGATTSSVSVTWSQPDNHASFYYYIVDCSPGVPEPDNITDGATTSATCSSVPAGSLVTVSVTTHSGSESNAVSTTVRVKPNSVDALSEVSATTNSVTASWQKPANEVTKFNISCSHGNPQPPVVTANESMTYNATCENIPLPGTECTMTVTSVSFDVDGDDRSITITADPIPPALVKTPSTVTSISVEWEKPDSVVDFYIIDCPDGTESSSNITAIDGTLNASCTELTVPGDLYNISVKSQSKEKLSVPATRSINALPASVNLKESQSHVDAVSATWMAPIGIFDQFNIQCAPAAHAEPLKEVILYDPSASSYKADCNVSVPGDLYDMIVVSRSGSQDSSSSTQQLRALPEAVGSFTVQDVTTDTVELQWTIKNKCQNNGCVWSSFNVSHTPDFLEKNVSQNELSTSFTPLTPGESYTFSIIVLSEDKESSEETVVERTIPETVGELNVPFYSTDFVQLNWTIKEICENNNGCVWDKYNLTYTSDRDPEKQLGPPLDSKDILTTNVSSLIPGENYTFFITVVSGEKESATETFVQRTLPESVEEFDITAYSTDMVMLNWTIKDICMNNSCEWDMYNIEYTVKSETNRKSFQELKNISSAEIRDLTPGESYDFFITVLSGDEESGYEMVAQRTLPESVEELSVTSYSTDMVMLNWTIKDICMNNSCVWDMYNIEYTVKSETNRKSFQELKNISSAEIRDLTPGESYDFFITVLSGDEESGYEMVAQRTLPESVEELGVTSYSTDMVMLTWTIKDICMNNSCVWDMYNIEYTVESETNRKSFQELKNISSAEIRDLTPGESYNFSITVLSGDEESDYKMVAQRTSPEKVGELRVPTNYSDRIVVRWGKPRGVVTSYDTTITGPGDNFDSKNVESEEVTYLDLTPGDYYNVTVCTISYEEKCLENSSIINIRTLPVLPSPPTRVSVEPKAMSISEVELTFQEPEEPNGVIMRYHITYVGSKNDDPNESEDTGDREIEANGENEFTVTFTGLWPGFTYTFSVSAENEAGIGEAAEDNTTLGQEEPDDSSAAEEDLARDAKPSIKSFSVNFLSGWFSHCNGELKNYSVFVVEVGGNETIGDSPRSYQQAQNKKPLPVYRAKSDDYPFPADYTSCFSQRKKRQTPSSEPVTIGDGACSDGYCNGELHGNREYRVKYRACNDMGCSETLYSQPIKTDLNNLSWGLPLLFILIILICALALFIVWKERKHPGSIKRYLPKSKGVDNPGFEQDKPMRRAGDTRPVKLTAFGHHLEDMSRDADYLFSEEYNDLRQVGKNQSVDAAQLEVNRVKNRFSNILPYDHTRVHLSPIDDEEGSDYINANYMLGFKSQREYIACQGPLQSTEEDMWRLVWEQGASLIVMVTQLMENGKIKCHQYWPDEGEGPVRYGEIVVNPGKSESTELWTRRNFQITKGPVTRPITHFNFLGWPDHGVPEKPDDLIKFVQTVRDCKKNDEKPTVVHCSAGVGRTGTFISLDTLMNVMKERDEVDIFGMVRSMRMNRCLMVQTESQYIFIHQCVMALLEGSSDPDVLYENVNGNGYYSEALI